MKNIKNQRGITLIALVITIIVLMILAGVAIAMLTGENGILTQVTQAKEETQEAEVEEKVKLAIMGSYDTDGKPDYAKVEEELGLASGTLNSLPKTVQVEGYDVTINQSGEVIVGEKENSSFDAVEWDKTATAEDAFKWGSDTPGDPEYNTIVGYNSKLATNTKVRVPSRAHRIVVQEGNYIDNDDIGRRFLDEITAIELPNTLTEIGYYAFGGNSGRLKSVEKIIIPDSVTSIGNHAFYNCDSLIEIVIPDSVTSIGYYAFGNCDSLININCEATSKPSGWIDSWNSGYYGNITWGYTGQ